MARPNRLEPAGVSLHVLQRGNNCAACFFNDIDRKFYLKCLAEAAGRRACLVHAYVLMTNHVHLLVTPKVDGAVSLMMQDLGSRYVRVINQVHNRTGTLWEGRFKSHLVDTERYLLACHRYIEMNPVRAGLVSRPEDYEWSSHLFYARGTKDRIVEGHPAFAGLGHDPGSRRENFIQMFSGPMEEREVSTLRHSINKGWALGSETFLDRVELLVGAPVRPPKRGRPNTSDHERLDGGGQAEMLL